MTNCRICLLPGIEHSRLDCISALRTELRKRDAELKVALATVDVRLRPGVHRRGMTEKTMLVLVCGSRNWRGLTPIQRELGALPTDAVILEGGCRGADLYARSCALDLGLDVIEVPANWARDGKAAGPIRNRKMLDMSPALVLAFHEDIENSKGTKDCVEQARLRGIPVKVIRE